MISLLAEAIRWMQSCAYIQPIASEPVGCFIIQQDYNPLHKTKRLTRVKRRKILDWPSQPSDWAPFQKVAVADTSSKELYVSSWGLGDHQQGGCKASATVFKSKTQSSRLQNCKHNDFMCIWITFEHQNSGPLSHTLLSIVLMQYSKLKLRLGSVV